MRKVIVTNIMTLDGFNSGPGGDPMVLNMDAAFDAYNLECMRSAGTILLGRRSFEGFSSFWPAVADAPDDPANPALSVTNREFSRLYRDIPKLVVSDTLDVATDNAWHDSTEVVSRATAAERIAAERAGGGGIVIYGSHLLWTALLAAGLIDELHLIVGPAAIGNGVPMFSQPTTLTLLGTRTFDGSSNVLLRYAPAA